MRWGLRFRGFGHVLPQGRMSKGFEFWICGVEFGVSGVRDMCATLGRSQDVCEESRLTVEGERCVVNS